MSAEPKEARRALCRYARVGSRGPQTRFVTKEYLCIRRQIATTGCWLWEGALGRHGYGKVRHGGRDIAVHRLAADLWGVLGVGPMVLHSCDTPRCFNPEHLRRGTQRQNMADAARRGRMASGARWDQRDLSAYRHASQRVLGEEKARQARALYDEGRSYRSIAAALGCSYSTIARICRGIGYAESA